MTGQEEVFFYFLRQGLWGAQVEEPIGSRLTKENWMWLLDEGCRQAVSGILIDGVAQSGIRPPDDLWEKWIVHLVCIERANCHIANKGVQWVDRLNEAGMDARVFKGPSVAHWYGKPSYRAYGDLDIVVYEGWGKLEAVLQAWNLPYRWEHEDIVLQDGLLPVEFHQRREYLYNPFINVRLQRMLREDKQGNELYLACLVLHLRRHVLTYGIGLKQVCDVAVMLRNASLDGQKLAEILHKLHAVKFSRVLFGFIATYIKGIDHFPLPPVYGKELELLESIIRKDGYMLKHEREAYGNGTRTAAIRVAGNGYFWLKRSIRLFSLMPSEACCFTVTMVVRRMREFFR